MNFTPQIAPLGSLWLSAIVGLLPLITMFVTLGWLRWKAHWAGLTALAVAIGVAVHCPFTKTGRHELRPAHRPCVRAFEFGRVAAFFFGQQQKLG